MRSAALFLLAVLGTSAFAADSASPTKKSPRMASAVTLRPSSCACGRCCVAVTANFRIFWCAEERDIRELAESCERLAADLKGTWLRKNSSADGTPGPSETPVGDWTPKCDVVVHPDVAAYVQALGPGSQQTSGCATIRLDSGRVVLRRIDFRADALDWQTETLPHELTHVVLADRFCRQRISPWADEGIAMLAETPEKLKRRLGELRQVAAGGATYAARDLINVRTSPEPAYRPAFYGQSLALVSLLLDWGSREQLLQFVETSQARGPESALREVYGARHANEAEQQFRDYLLTERPLIWSRQNVLAAATQSKSGTIAD